MHCNIPPANPVFDASTLFAPGRKSRMNTRESSVHANLWPSCEKTIDQRSPKFGLLHFSHGLPCATSHMNTVPRPVRVAASLPSGEKVRLHSIVFFTAANVLVFQVDVSV